MDTFLVQLFGLYFLIMGVIVTIRRKSVMPAIGELVHNRPVLLLMGVIELAAGLAIVVAYPAITANALGVVSLIGWVMLIEGIIYLMLPLRAVQRLVRSFNTPAWYVYGGSLAMVLGGYLAGTGFGYF